MATEGEGTVLLPGEGQTVSLPGNEISFLRSQPDGAYSLVEWVAAPGAPGTPLHTHAVTDEGFYVLEGTFCFRVGEETAEATVTVDGVHQPGGDIALVDDGARHEVLVRLAVAAEQRSVGQRA